MSGWYLYIIRTGGGVLYTGITTDTQRRLAEHRSGFPKGARSLRGKGPLQLVYQVEVGDRRRALQLEWRIKRWPRQRKQALVDGREALPENPDSPPTTGS